MKTARESPSDTISRRTTCEKAKASCESTLDVQNVDVIVLLPSELVIETVASSVPMVMKDMNQMKPCFGNCVILDHIPTVH